MSSAGIEEPYRVERFTNHHRRKGGFSCGDDALDRYFYTQASQDERRDLARIYVAVSGSEEVVGYFTLSSFTIFPSELAPEIKKRLPRYDAFPTILIGRLAVDRRYQGKGLGGALLIRALRECYSIRQNLGVMAVQVDAKDRKAADFYEHFTFRRFDGDDLRLYLPMTEIAKLVELP